MGLIKLSPFPALLRPGVNDSTDLRPQLHSPSQHSGASGKSPCNQSDPVGSAKQRALSPFKTAEGGSQVLCKDRAT